ncbi:uncharacterized protein LOC108113861 [Drosophila eugracilis]|uniref:uncharacterized protein LOC108113861 n=1 Tax=Drosophila eugracilis TaxID=29029 RepID=UPI001BD9A56F|nr:uncharacterized protein LOC108113861 [Drosophila eugracilis]
MTKTRNFLLENRMMVSQGSPSYQKPTLASRARCCGSVKLPLAKPQRRAGRPAQTISNQQELSEKQIQTEDISDERFLSAALLKCTDKSQSQFQSRSEGDDPLNGRGELFSGEGLQLRCTASNFELGTVPKQRIGYQPGQYTLHRPLANVFGILPGGLCFLDNCCSSIVKQDDNVSMSSHSSTASSPRVRQMDIPEVVDVDPEDVLSVKSQASLKKEAQPQEESEPQDQVNLQPASPKEQETQPILISSEQRRALLDAARERQSQLIAQYNRLPLSMGTLRVRNLKRQLEQQLDLVDHDLSMLSQAKVYLKQESNCGTVAYEKLYKNV